jgi:hypothetical protein
LTNIEASLTPADVSVPRRRMDVMETWADVVALAPAELRPWLLDVEWSRERLWALPLPERELPIGELLWLLDLPWWRGEDGRVFSVRPSDVRAGPHLVRAAEADLALPLHVTERHARWVILDGMHRLLRAHQLGWRIVRVRVVPTDALAYIAA